MAKNPDHHFALPVGHHVGDYEVLSILGHGGFGITYLAEDTKLRAKVAIKEYLPADIAVRTDDLSVRSRTSDDEGDFAWGLDRFLKEAQTLARFSHPNIVGVRRFFEENGTAYMVMDYQDGDSLSSVLDRHDRLEESEIFEILTPLLDGLEAVHAKDILHRDIKPGNIYLRKDGTPVLLDFGAARTALGQRSMSLHKVFTPGYAPAEQYETSGDQGPWTDIYGMGAVLYRIIAGGSPPEATQRTGALARKTDDPMKPAVRVGKGKYSKSFLEAIDWALNIVETERPQSVAQWRPALFGSTNEGTLLGGASAADPEAPVKTIRKRAPQPGATIEVKPAGERGRAAQSEDDAARRRKNTKLMWILLGTGTAATVAAGVIIGLFVVRPPGFDPVKDIWVVDPSGAGRSATIADAIKRAPARSRISIKPGVYAESLTISKELHLGGDQSNRNAVVIRTPSGSCVMFSAAAGSIRHMRLQNAGTAKTACVTVAQGELVVENTVISSGTGAGIEVRAGARAQIRRNAIQSAKASGVQIDGEKAWAQVDDNRILNNRQNGVLIRNKASAKVTNNRIYTNRLHGVYVHSDATGEITNNTIYANRRANVGVSRRAAPTVSGNTIYASTNAGISIWANAKGRFENNQIRANVRSNVTVHDGADPVFVNNRIYASKQAGVFVLQNGRGRFEGNQIYGNADAGILVANGGNPVIVGNKIRNGRKNGVFVTNSAKGTFENNDIYGNASAGVNVARSSDPIFRGNRIYNGKKSGVFVNTRGRGRFENNSIYGNTYSGIQVKSEADPYFRNNKIYNGRQDGVWVLDRGRGRFENNEIYGNRRYGVAVKNGGNPVVRGNRIYRNLRGSIGRETGGRGRFVGNTVE